MSVVVIGLQHKQAPLLAPRGGGGGDADLHKVLAALSHRRNLQETVVLSTCLRTEVYSVVDRFHDAVAEVYEVLAEHAVGVSTHELAAGATVRFDDDVTSHLFAVTAGSSPRSWGRARWLGRSGGPSRPPAPRSLWSGPSRRSFNMHCRRASAVRTETGISRGTTSFAHAAVTVARGGRPGALRQEGRRRRGGRNGSWRLPGPL